MQGNAVLQCNQMHHVSHSVVTGYTSFTPPGPPDFEVHRFAIEPTSGMEDDRSLEGPQKKADLILQVGGGPHLTSFKCQRVESGCKVLELVGRNKCWSFSFVSFLCLGGLLWPVWFNKAKRSFISFASSKSDRQTHVFASSYCFNQPTPSWSTRSYRFFCFSSLIQLHSSTLQSRNPGQGQFN